MKALLEFHAKYQSSLFIYDANGAGVLCHSENQPTAATTSVPDGLNDHYEIAAICPSSS
jgi:hypothetical protein